MIAQLRLEKLNRLSTGLSDSSISENYFVDFSKPIDISIPMSFDKNQPNNYSVPFASAIPYQDGQFIGNVSMGGGCNFDVVSLIPHCNGTHTECIGHITAEKESINQKLTNFTSIALVITIEPKVINEEDNSNAKYTPDIELNNDKIISEIDLKNAINRLNNIGIIDYEAQSYLVFNGVKIDSLIIRTLPNEETKKSIDYMINPPAYFTNDAVEYINRLNIKNLLLDLPSIDRQFDEGKLSSHHIFWGLDSNNKVINPDYNDKTITEMIFVKNDIIDGTYLLQLNIAPFELDATPSKPILYKLFQDEM